MITNNWKQILEEMCGIYTANFTGEPMSCALLPHGAGVYLNALVEAERHIEGWADFDRVVYYRKIERLFVDDWAGTVEMSRILSRILHGE